MENISSFMSSDTSTLDPAWKIGLRGARANFLPGIVLWVVSLTVVLAYYYHAPTRALLEQLAVFKARTGFLYSFVATSVFGGLLPFLYLRADPASRNRYAWSHLWFFLVFWGYKGVEVDLFYRAQALLFGSTVNMRTVLSKMIFDMFFFCPIYAIPVTVLAYASRSEGLRRVLQRAWQRPGFYAREILPPMIANSGLWIPAVCLIYALPLPLQIPLFNLVLCFSTLLFSYVTAHVRRT